MSKVVASSGGVTVAYDPARVSPARIAATVTADTGYLPRPIRGTAPGE